MATRVERYLEFLDGITGGREPEFHPVAGTQGRTVHAIVYRDLPERGLLTAFTYGLSKAEHPAWRYGRPELCITVASGDAEWGTSIALLAADLAGDCPFSYGNTLLVGQPLTDDTEMEGFVVFAPACLDREDFRNVLGEPEGAGPQDVIHLAGMYPVHASELDFIRDRGLEEFWKLDWDLFDPQRGPAM